MITGYRILTVACVTSIIAFSFKPQMVLAQGVSAGNAIEKAPLEEEGPTRSPAVAVWASVGPTALVGAVGGGLFAAKSESLQVAGAITLGTGLIFLPSIGQWYSGRWIRGTLFTLGRAGAVAMITSGWLVKGFAEWCGPFTDSSPCMPQKDEGGWIALVAVGSAALAALTIWDIVDSYSSAKKFNEEHAKKSISVSPFVMPSESRNKENGTAYGLAVAGHF
jgi:hypothetical protein